MLCNIVLSPLVQKAIHLHREEPGPSAGLHMEEPICRTGFHFGGVGGGPGRRRGRLVGRPAGGVWGRAGRAEERPDSPPADTHRDLPVAAHHRPHKFPLTVAGHAMERPTSYNHARFRQIYTVPVTVTLSLVKRLGRVTIRYPSSDKH